MASTDVSTASSTAAPQRLPFIPTPPPPPDPAGLLPVRLRGRGAGLGPLLWAPVSQDTARLLGGAMQMRPSGAGRLRRLRRPGRVSWRQALAEAGGGRSARGLTGT